MIVDDKARVIGKVIGINTELLSVELSRDIVNFTINGFDDIHYVAQLNGYVVIPYLNFYIVGEVVSIKEKEVYQSASNLKDQELLKSKSTKVIEVTPFGSLIRKSDKSLAFTFGVSNFPSLYSDVLYIKDEELDSIYTNTNSYEDVTGAASKNTHIPIGISSIFKDYEVKADIDKLFGSHSAVLGNTGSGKSCTISSILQTIYKKQNHSAVGSTFLIFDVNGEYAQALGKLDNPEIFCKVKVINKDKRFKLPHWYLTFEEWELLLNASEKTQKPILHNALGLSGMLTNGDDASINHIVASCVISLFANSESSVSLGNRADMLIRTYGKGTLSGDLLTKYGFIFQFGNFPKDTPHRDNFLNFIRSHIHQDFQLPTYENKPFHFKELITYIDLAILYEESHGNKQVRDYCSSLITRTKNIIKHPAFSFIGEDPSNYIPKRDFLFDILGIGAQGIDVIKKSQILIFDLNEAEDEAVLIVSAVVSRLVLELLKLASPRNEFPINLILEEAHRYISTAKLKEFTSGNNIFERIAKEGRKYGVFLLISSQRPSELSRTVLSQCSNFIVHRIQNPEDLSHIRQITPHISDVLLKRLPSIPKQHALIFGACVNIPSLIKILEADPRPKSDDNKISDNWFIPLNKAIPVTFD